MKVKIYGFFAALVVAALCTGSCKKNDNGDGATVVPVPVKQDVTFSFAQKGLKAGSLVTDARYVVVTIENANGDTVFYNLKKLDLYNFGGSLISQPLALAVSSKAYKLTQFVVLDGSDKVIFATPLDSSPLASLVADALPIDIVVTKDLSTNVVPEVLATETSPVADFGYATFVFSVVDPIRFLMGVQVYNATTHNWEMATANISVKDAAIGGLSLYTGNIGAITDTVNVKDGYAKYLVSVSKAGYGTKDVTLTNAQLKTYLGAPLLFLLQQPTDYDGNVYPVVTIGTQTWMAENLKATHYRNGAAIPNVTDNTVWAALASGARCYYDNDSAMYKAAYGALYNWYAVADARNIAPAGWHVPTDAEWTTLTTYLGGGSVAGVKLKETGTTHWKSPNQWATNSSGFTALPGGGREFGGGGFTNIGIFGYWWSSTEYSSSSAWTRYMGFYEGNMNWDDYDEVTGFSVRCLRD